MPSNRKVGGQYQSRRADSPMDDQYSKLEDQLDEMWRARDLPELILVAGDTSGALIYQDTFGQQSLRAPLLTPMLPIEEAIFDLEACTEIMTAICVMQLVEQGLIDLDDDISNILPELKNPVIIVGFHDSSQVATFEKARNSITLRHLLTHQSGLSHPALSPLITKYKISREEPIFGLRDRPQIADLTMPLLFEPGSSFSHGVSIYWVEVIVSRLTSLSLLQYMRKYLFQPLGIGPTSDLPLYEEWEGTSNAFGNLTDLVEILQSLTSKSCPILRQSTITEIFRPQLSRDAQIALSNYVYGTDAHTQNLTDNLALDWGLGGIINMDTTCSARSYGSLSCGNIHDADWWVDRRAGVYGVVVLDPFTCSNKKASDAQSISETKHGSLRIRFNVSDTPVSTQYDSGTRKGHLRSRTMARIKKWMRRVAHEF